MYRFTSLIDNINAWMGRFVSYATVLMALITFAIVVLRYGFNVGWIAMQESVTYLHACVFLLGAAYTYQQNGHVRVDVFYRNFSARKQALIDFCGALLFMHTLSLYLVWACFDYVIDSWRILESSREPGGLPFVYLLKSLLLIFAVSLYLQSISEIIKKGLIVFSKAELKT